MKPALLTEDVQSRGNDIVSSGGRNPRALAAVSVQLLIYFAVVLSLQYIGGAFRDDFGGASDEPSHYVTAVMVRDYFAAGFPRGIMRFGEDFYIHYPKMAMGHWPPVAYIVLGTWMLIVGPGRTSVLVLIALLNATCALALFLVARRVLFSIAAHLIAILFLILPLVQLHCDMVMLEVPLMLVSFLAVLAFNRLLVRDTWANAFLFGLLASAAILIKGNAWALVLVPAISLLLLGELRRVLNLRLLAAAAIVGVTCVPFTLWSMHVVQDGWDSDTWTWQFTVKAVPSISQFMFATVGVVLALCFCAGIWQKVLVPLWHRRLESFWAVMTAYVVSIWFFHVMVPTSLEPRKVLMAAPAMLLFAGAGIGWFAQILPLRSSLVNRQLFVAAAVSLAFLAVTFEIPRTYCPGFDRAAQFLLSKPELKDAAFFISSATDGEGRFIAEVANREVWPRHVLIRANKALVRTNWLMNQYQLRYKTAAEVGDLLNYFGVAIVVLHTDINQPITSHHKLLSSLLNQSSDWQKIYSDYPHCSRHGAGEEIAIYSYKPDPFRKLSHVEVDLENKLGRTLQR